MSSRCADRPRLKNKSRDLQHVLWPTSQQRRETRQYQCVTTDTLRGCQRHAADGLYRSAPPCVNLGMYEAPIHHYTDSDLFHSSLHIVQELTAPKPPRWGTQDMRIWPSSEKGFSRARFRSAIPIFLFNLTI